MTADSIPEESRPQGRRRPGIAIAVVLLLLIVVRAALPVLVERAAVRWARAETGFEVDVRDVDLEILAGRIAFDGLSLSPPHETSEDEAPGDAPAPLLTWERVSADLAWSYLLMGRIHLTEISVRAPQVEFARQPDGSLDPLAGASPIESDPEDDAGDGGLPVTIDRMTVHAARLRIIDGADGSELLALELDDVAFDDFALEEGEISLGGIRLQGPKLRVVRDFALSPTGPAVPVAESPTVAEPEVGASDMAPTAAQEEGTADPVAVAPAESRPLIDRIEIEGAEFSLLAGDRDVRLVASLHAEQIGRDTKAVFPLQLSLEAEDGMLDLDGRMAFSPFVLAGELRWKDLPIPLLAVSLRPDLSEWVRSCRAGGEVSVDIDLGGSDGRKPSIRFEGNADVSGLEIVDPRDGALSVALKEARAKIENLTIPLDEEATEPLRIVLADVRFEEPNATYTHPSDAIERLFLGPQEDVGDEDESVVPPEPSSEVSRPVDIRLRNVEIIDGSLKLADESVTPNYDVLAREFEADLKGVSLGGPISIESVDASFRSRGNTRARVVGRLGSNSGNFDVDADRVALPPLNGYASAGGIEVVEGALSSNTKVDRAADVWTFDNDITLHGLKLDPKGSEGFGKSVGMPTDVILALLRDMSGDISLPVEFSIGGGATNVGVSSGIISALRQALVGAASIPLKSVGSLLRLGGGGMRVEAIPAEPGFPTFGEDAAERIAGLAGLLDVRPKLGITLVGSIGDGDRDGLAGRILAESLEAGGNLPEIAAADAGLFARRRIERALSARARGEVSPLEESDEELLLAYVKATDVPGSRFDELAQQRAQRLRDELVTGEGVSPERIRISEDTRDDAPGVEIVFFVAE